MSSGTHSTNFVPTFGVYNYLLLYVLIYFLFWFILFFSILNRRSIRSRPGLRRNSCIIIDDQRIRYGTITECMALSRLFFTVDKKKKKTDLKTLRTVVELPAQNGTFSIIFSRHLVIMIAQPIDDMCACTRTLLTRDSRESYH